MTENRSVIDRVGGGDKDELLKDAKEFFRLELNNKLK